MADVLNKFYEDAAKIGALKAKMRLAVLTLIPSSKANTELDSPENIHKFEIALQEIKKEFSTNE